MEGEARFIEEARKGSERAFLELLREHQGRVRAYLWRYLRARDIVDDLAQETFLTAFRTLSTYKGDSAFGIWLLGIARNRALTYLRDERLRRSKEQDSFRGVVAAWRAETCQAAGEPPGRNEKELAALRECMKGLQEHGAELISERYVRRRTSRAIARQLGRKESAVRMSLFRIRQTLKDCVKSRMAGAEANS